MVVPSLINCGPRGETEGAKPGSGVQRFWGPLGPRNSTPRFSHSGSRKPLPRGPLEARKGSQGLGGGSSGASERCVRFQRSRERRWAIQRPLRGSGSYLQATDNLNRNQHGPQSPRALAVQSGLLANSRGCLVLLFPAIPKCPSHER